MMQRTAHPQVLLDHSLQPEHVPLLPAGLHHRLGRNSHCRGDLTENVDLVRINVELELAKAYVYLVHSPGQTKLVHLREPHDDLLLAVQSGQQQRRVNVIIVIFVIEVDCLFTFCRLLKTVSSFRVWTPEN